MPTQPTSPKSAPDLCWFDAHLDLAYLAVSGRDMLAPADRASPPHPPSCCTLPALAEGNVRFALATIFTEVDGSGPESYPAGDVERAHRVGRAQLEAYLTWRDRGLLSLDLVTALRQTADLAEVRGGMGVASAVPLSTRARLATLTRAPALRVGILIENADPIRSPDELSWWHDRGVAAVGLTWARSSRYAGGNTSTVGVSDLGRALVRELDRLAIVHDASHLSDRAFDDLLELTDRTIIASHSNCRALLDPSAQNQRHATDAQIRAIAARGGVIGLNLYSKFIDAALFESGRASIAACVRHIEHVAEIAQAVSPFASGRSHVALGSDLDGGFSADRLPQGIDSPAGYERLAEALAERGWTDDEVLDFRCGNWLRVFSDPPASA